MSPLRPLLAALLCPMVLIAASAASLPDMPQPRQSDRILVIAPHPDDESLCCAGILQRAHANGAAVGVVWITAGDSFLFDALVVERSLRPRGAPSRRLGAQRLLEAHAAANELGVPRTAQFVLGYPDRGLSALIADYYRAPYLSPYTAVSAVPYADALSPGASYTGEHLEGDLERVLERRGELNELRYWIVHAPLWPWPPIFEPQLALAPPATATALRWQSMALSATERAHKRAALRAHRSQFELLAPFMNSFVRANEIVATD